MSTFVSVGNSIQPFSRLLDEVVRIIETLPQPVVVQYGSTPFQAHNCVAARFVDMNEFESLIESSELLILHAGAGSVIHAVRAGKLPVLMPRREMHGEHVDDHQLEFAYILEAAGRVIIAEEPQNLSLAVQRALTLQSEVSRDSGYSPMLKIIDDTLAKFASRCPN
jgi:UDP-N-acetylglucosamine transferase subunit ALG13